MTGSTIITATKAADDNYNEATGTYMLTVVAAPVPLALLGADAIPDQAYTVAEAVTFILPQGTGGTDPLSYSLTPAGDIPAGMMFTAAQALTGTPTMAMGAVTLTYTVTDSALPPATTFRTVTVTVAKGTQAPLMFNPVAETKDDDAPDFTPRLTGGTGAGLITYVSGTPAVASVDRTTGLVTIAMTGSTIITATKAADDNYNEATGTYTLTVVAAPVPLALLGADAIPDQAYTVAEAVTFILPQGTGGTDPLSYSLTPAGDIPAGMMFTAAQALTGTPTMAMGAVTLTYTVTDSALPPATTFRTVTVTVAKGTQAPLMFNPVAETKDDDAPDFTPRLTGGTGAGLITYVSGTPAVASVDRTTGLVTIAMTGSTIITATKAADDNYNEATGTYMLTVVAAPVPLALLGADAIPDQAYTVAEAVTFILPQGTGGTDPLSYSLTPAGDIPAGMMFTAAQALTGTPTMAMGAVTLTYTVTDSALPPATTFRTVTVTVAKGTQAPLMFNPVAETKDDDAPDFTPRLTGGTGAGLITYVSGTPAVASVDRTTGLVTIAMTGSTIITATKAADDNYNEATGTYMLTVVAAPVPLALLGADAIPDQAYTVAEAVTFILPQGTGGTDPLSYSLTPAGDIPAGMMFTAAQALTGTPTMAMGAVTLTYTVTDSALPPATTFRTVTVTVAKGTQAPLMFNPVAETKDDDAPDFTPRLTGGTGAGLITYVSGTPAVASVDRTTGLVTIAMTGSTIITATKAADDNYNEATGTYMLTVVAAPVPLALLGADAIPDQAYTVAEAVTFILPQGTGGTDPLSYSLTPAGDIPAGMMFTAAQALTGTPTMAMGAVTLTYTVTDSATANIGHRRAELYGDGGQRRRKRKFCSFPMRQ